MKTGISQLQGLNDDQLAQILPAIEEFGYRQATANLSEQFARSIPKTSLQRFAPFAATAEMLQDTPETAQAAKEILRAAVTGQPEFSAATQAVLEESAFKLSLTATRVKEDMKALTKIASMLCRFRNTAVRERMAAVQERKCQLREQELKKSKPSASQPRPTSTLAPANTTMNPDVSATNLALSPKTWTKSRHVSVTNLASPMKNGLAANSSIPPMTIPRKMKP